MTFQLVCRITAIIGLILFVVLLTVPGSYTATYGVAADQGGVFMARRASPLFLGIAVLLWMLADQTDAAVQRAISIAMVATFVGVAVTGLFAFATGVASSAILLAGLGELIIAAAFWVVRPKT